MGFSRQEYWSGLPFPSPVDHILSDLSTMTRPSWVAPQAWLGFIELDKSVVLVWLDWLVFCEYGFSVSALWCPLATPTILFGFLLPWVWGSSSRLLQQSTATAPYLEHAVSWKNFGNMLSNRSQTQKATYCYCIISFIWYIQNRQLNRDRKQTVAGWDLVERRMGSNYLMGMRFLLGVMKNVLKLDNGDGCTTLWMY